MKEYYGYDEIYGTLLHKNKDDTKRKYFIVECEYWKFYRWMFSHGWNKIRGKPYVRNGLNGFKVTLHR